MKLLYGTGNLAKLKNEIMKVLKRQGITKE